MFFYDWKKIVRYSGKKPSKIRKIFSCVYKKHIPLNKFDICYEFSGVDFRGTSFLANPEPFWENLYTHRDRDIAIYLSLASMRSYPEYRFSGILDLDEKFVPINDLESRIFDETLIYRENGRIKFFYEEALKQGEIANGSQI